MTIPRMKVPIKTKAGVVWTCLFKDGADQEDLATAINNAQAMFAKYISNIGYHGIRSCTAERVEGGHLWRLLFGGSRGDVAKLRRRGSTAFGYVTSPQVAPGLTSEPLVIEAPEPVIEGPAPLPDHPFALRKIARDRGLDVSDITGAGSCDRLKARINASMASCPAI